jgi:hypothetical protein
VRTVPRVLALAVAVLMGAAPAPAQETGQAVRGEVIAVALGDTPRRVTVRLDDGTEVEAVLAPRTRVTARPGVWRFGPKLVVPDLQRGMAVAFRWDPKRVDRIQVVAVPPDARPGGGTEAPDTPSWGGARPSAAYEAGRELEARVVAVNVAGGRLTVSVDGREQVFLGAAADLRGLARGDRVVLVIGEDGRLASVRARASRP